MFAFSLFSSIGRDDLNSLEGTLDKAEPRYRQRVRSGLGERTDRMTDK
jgi:hypothetical protein